MKSALLKDLLDHTKDGEWGKGEAANGLTEMAVIRGTDFEKVRFGDISSVPTRFIPDRICERKTLRPNDILIETAGGTVGSPTGKTVFLSERTMEAFGKPVTCASFSRFLRVKEGAINPHFLFWCLRNLWEARLIFDYHIQHTGVARFQYTQFASEQRIPLPDEVTQHEIASILGALDDKIELNRRMSATLEEMARSLYRSWFVDFDPVHAKMEGRQPAFMDEATAALFPERFGDDGLPEGWERACIGDIAQLNPEKHTKKNHPDTVEYVDLSNTKWGIIETTTQYSWEEAPSRARMLLREQDTIVGTVRPGNGSYSYIGKDGLTGSTGFAVLRPTDTADIALVYLSATDINTIDALANLADGGAYPAVRPDVVASQPVVLSSHDVRTAFQELVAPLIGKIEASKAQSQTLASLRDSLLPKLMSGELRVSDARNQIEEVA